MVSTAQTPDFFRYPVTPEESAATIRIRRNQLAVQLQEASIDGFTVLVRPRDAAQLRIGEPWLLDHAGSRLEVHAQWFFQSADGHVQIGLRRLRDLTRAPSVSVWRPRFLPGSPTTDNTGRSLFLTGILLVGLLVLALPGVGDALGTSGSIQAVMKILWSGLRGA